MEVLAFALLQSALHFAPLVSAGFGGISASIGIANYLRKPQAATSYDAMSTFLMRYGGGDGASASRKEAQQMRELLSLGDAILGPLRTKLMGRLLAAIVIGITGIGIQIAEVANGKSLTGLQEIITSAGFLTVLLASIATIDLSRLLPPYEREFLRNFRVLNEWFFAEYVQPAMVELNRSAPGIRAFRMADADVKKRDKAIQEAVSAAVARILQARQSRAIESDPDTKKEQPD